MLDLGAPLVKPGGRLVYVTCSVLPEENGDQVAAFLANHPDFATLPWRDAWRAALGGDPPTSADGSDATLLLTPARHGTDGFFIAVLRRQTSGHECGGRTPDARQLAQRRHRPQINV